MYDNPNFKQTAFVQIMKRPILSAVIKIPVNPSEDTYREPSKIEKEIIHEIICTVGKEMLLTLGYKASHLRDLGAQIAHVHPLQFLATIFSDPELKSYMAVIFDTNYTDFRKDNFMNGGLTANLNRESDRGRLKNHLEDFARRVHADPEKLAEFFNNRKWEEMVEFLINS